MAISQSTTHGVHQEKLQSLIRVVTPAGTKILAHMQTFQRDTLPSQKDQKFCQKVHLLIGKLVVLLKSLGLYLHSMAEDTPTAFVLRDKLCRRHASSQTT